MSVRQSPFHEAYFISSSFTSASAAGISHQHCESDAQQQTNIYGLLPLAFPGGSTKLLVATVRGQVMCVEFQSGSLRPSVSPIHFSYLPADAEIVSIDALVKDVERVVVGITFVKRDSEPKEAFFNLYGVNTRLSQDSPFSWEKITEDWNALDLKFTPFQLTHTEILVGEKLETVFLLPGDDFVVHVYRETLGFSDDSSEPWFPELRGVPSSITKLEVFRRDYQRVTALGCQSGYLKCSLVDMTRSEETCVLKSFCSEVVDGPITCLHLFTCESSSVHAPELDSYHLLVGSAIELGVVFLNIIRLGFSHSVSLPHSSAHDSIMCGLSGDLNWDGRPELLLGTYGKEILAYELDTHGGSSTAVGTGNGTCTCTGGVECLWRHSLAHPVLALWHGDITRDGLGEVVALSTRGLHILQHDLSEACAVLTSRLEEKPFLTDASSSMGDGKKDTEGTRW